MVLVSTKFAKKLITNQNFLPAGATLHELALPAIVDAWKVMEEKSVLPAYLAAWDKKIPILKVSSIYEERVYCMESSRFPRQTRRTPRDMQATGDLRWPRICWDDPWTEPHLTSDQKPWFRVKRKLYYTCYPLLQRYIWIPVKLAI